MLSSRSSYNNAHSSSDILVTDSVSLDVPSPPPMRSGSGVGSPGKDGSSPQRYSSNSNNYQQQQQSYTNNNYALAVYAGDQDESRYAELLGGNRRSRAPNEDALELFNTAQLEQQRLAEETLGASAALGDKLPEEEGEEDDYGVEAFEEIDPFVSTAI